MKRELGLKMPRICIIGIGNEFRTDDRAGIIVARKLREYQIPGVRVCELSGEGGGLMEAWDGKDIVFLVDAVSSGAPVGTVFTIDANQHTIPSRFFHYSTHAFSLAESVELAKVLGRLPSRCIVYGIEGKEFREGTRPTPAVLAAADKVVRAIVRQIRSVSTVMPRRTNRNVGGVNRTSPTVQHRVR
jgi:hydrogenase maturation protease